MTAFRTNKPNMYLETRYFSQFLLAKAGTFQTSPNRLIPYRPVIIILFYNLIWTLSIALSKLTGPSGSTQLHQKTDVHSVFGMS
jgi:hypothetical protein